MATLSLYSNCKVYVSSNIQPLSYFQIGSSSSSVAGTSASTSSFTPLPLLAPRPLLAPHHLPALLLLRRRRLPPLLAP